MTVRETAQLVTIAAKMEALTERVAEMHTETREDLQVIFQGLNKIAEGEVFLKTAVGHIHTPENCPLCPRVVALEKGLSSVGKTVSGVSIWRYTLTGAFVVAAAVFGYLLNWISKQISLVLKWGE